MIACARCPAPKCGRWYLRNAGRGDRWYCCHACQMPAWRVGWARQIANFEVSRSNGCCPAPKDKQHDGARPANRLSSTARSAERDARVTRSSS